MVAGGAGGHAVLPRMGATPAARDHVVDGVGLLVAVGAAVVVPPHQGRAGQRDPVAIRDPYVAPEPDDRRGGQGHRRGVQGRPGGVAVDHLGFPAEHQADGAT